MCADVILNEPCWLGHFLGRSICDDPRSFGGVLRSSMIRFAFVELFTTVCSEIAFNIYYQ